ncbi:MAG: ABC transporter permease [Bacteroidales bacterium]|nr:ABC transporter permease [Lachnoclostridium sp.]MCM1383418.1 ABC transporter permease [Lachnoclostridium sp.]MCM1464265.1 ABC transporter permease [Bacteroidales bacterium]
MEEVLTQRGNYDVIVYGMEEKDLSVVTGNKAVSSYGFYRELGYAGVDGGGQYKVVSFPNEHSEQMYHMTCIRGSYPQKEGQIAMDAGIAKQSGIPPFPGQKVTLALYDMEKQKLQEREYTVSGIFEASSPGAWGGFHRYWDNGGMEEYGVPAVFVFDGERELFPSTQITVFFQTETEESGALAAELLRADFPKLGCDDPMGRAMAYYRIITAGEHVLGSEYGLNIDGLQRAMRDGNVWKDFYSSVLIPMFAALILVIAAISVFGTTWEIIMGRSREVAILRSIGMTRQGIFLYLLLEQAAFISIFIGAGLLAGSGFHYLLVTGMNAHNGTDIPLGFHVGSYVASVTFNPWLYATAVIGISSMAAVFWPLFEMSKSAPIAVFKMGYEKEESPSRQHFTDFSGRTWSRVIGRHIRFHEKSVLIIMTIIMCATFFGYNYFRAFSDMENIEYANQLSESGLDGWDFSAEKSQMSRPYVFLVENRHDSGIDQETYERFAGEDFVKESFARMVNKSTRLVYPKKEEKDAVKEMLAPFSMRRYELQKESEDDYGHTEYEAEEAMLEQTGYYSDEDIYALPTVGILPEGLEELSPYVTDGKIDPDKIRSGEEVILVVPSEIKSIAEAAFHAGDELPLSDILLSKEEEGYDFSQSPFDYAEPVYRTYVEDPSGAKIRYASFAFGMRKDIHTRIGAVVVLDDARLCKKYLLESQELSGYCPYEIPYAPCLLCMPETFASWGLPDRLFTEARFSVTDGGRLSEANTLFYESVVKCRNITFASTFEIREKMKAREGNTMTIYYIMIVMLIFLGMLAVGILFYSRIKLNSQTIARLRAIGMSLPQLEWLILRQNIAYPLIGGAMAVIPTFLCQMLFGYIKRQIDTGAWAGVILITADSGGMPWYSYVPFRYSLFAYHPAAVLLAVVLVFEILILAATIPQIHYMRRQVISEIIDRDSF